MELLVWLEATGLATWVRESGSLWAYPLVITLHTLGLSILVGGSVVIDLRLLGAARALPVVALGRLFPLLWTGFVINATSGFLLFMAAASTKAFQAIFWVKLACIAAGVATLYLLHTRAFGDAPVVEDGVPTHAKRMAVVSLLVWTGAIVAGRLMAYL